jgi:hypothetical protein
LRTGSTARPSRSRRSGCGQQGRNRLSWARGTIVDALVSRGLDALSEAADEDDRVEALARFIHVAEESDDFGFDILGWVAVAENDERPLLLEVKSVDGRSFLASAGEWSRAEEQRELFAFMCVQRPAGAGAIDLLIDPAHPEEGRQVVREADRTQPCPSG